MTSADAAAVVGGVALAALLGRSDAPNASAAMVSSRAGRWPGIAGWSALWHLVGGLVAGTAVARTVLAIDHVGPAKTAAVLAAGALSSVAFTWVTTWRGLPTSASVGLVGGLAGAGVVARGWGAVDWWQLHGLRPGGVVGVLVGLVLAPVLGGAVAGALTPRARRLAYRLRRSARRQVRAGTWLTSAAVAFADGTNDGQKAMVVLAAGLSATGTGGPGLGITVVDRVVVAVVLAVGTAVGGRRLIRTVSRGLARADPVDDLVAESASAGIILLSALGGLPLSTSTVVTSSRVGAGLADRRRHVRWRGVAGVAASWAVTVPACALLGAGLLEAWQAVVR